MIPRDLATGFLMPARKDLELDITAGGLNFWGESGTTFLLRYVSVETMNLLLTCTKIKGGDILPTSHWGKLINLFLRIKASDSKKLNFAGQDAIALPTFTYHTQQCSTLYELLASNHAVLSEVLSFRYFIDVLKLSLELPYITGPTLFTDAPYHPYNSSSDAPKLSLRFQRTYLPK